MKRTVKKPAERKAEIILAAKYLFQTTEYENTSMQDIIEHLGIAKGTVYHYFRSKEELLEAVVEDIINNLVELMQARVLAIKGGALQKMKVLIETGNIAATQPHILEGLHSTGNEALHIRLLAATVIKLAPLYAQIIQQGCDEGIFKTRCPLESAEFILAASQFLTDRGIYSWSDEDLQRRMHALPKLIEQQLQAPQGSFDFLITSLKTK